jgi:hypothetical protein
MSLSRNRFSRFSENVGVVRLRLHLAYRWFCRLDLDDAIR